MPVFPEYVLALIATTLTATLAIYAWKHRGVAGALGHLLISIAIEWATAKPGQ